MTAGQEPSREQLLGDIEAVARRKAEMRAGLGKLEERQRGHILLLRSWGWGYGRIAKVVGLSRSRVQQLSGEHPTTGEGG